jgi:hypothetical protein
MRWIPTIITLLALVPATTAALAMTDQDRRTAALCEAATRKAEFTERVPRGLLEAISLKESGRWDDEEKRSVPWPWTVTSGGPGEYFATREEALAKVRELRSDGVTNIDVGCMQVNLRYHPHAFETIEDAFDPLTNASYAGAHLKQLREDHHSWHRAVERYHSGDPERGAAYREAVYKLKFTATTSRMVAAREDAKLGYRERLELQRRNYEVARQARLDISRQQEAAKTEREKELRAEFEERRARVFQRWEEMMRKRREEAGKNS